MYKDKVKHYLSNKTTRIYLLEKNIYLFGLYYFIENFKSPSAEFHKKWAYYLGTDFHLLFVAFRESAKTFWAFVKFMHNICYKKKRFQTYYCYDKKKSASRLFDIAIALQTNKKIINDFGVLFPSKLITNAEQETQKKSIVEFITTNGVKCKAMSIGESPRGELYIAKDGSFRPDGIFLDDIDVDKSVTNPDVIEKNYNWIKGELLGGIAEDAQIIFLGNIIKVDGIVPRFEADYKNNPNWRTFRKALIEGGKITWPERFDWEDIEEKKNLLGEISFNQNMLLIPYMSYGNAVFNQEYIQSLSILDYEKDLRYKELRIYKKPSIDLYIGIDTAGGGTEGDYSTITGIDGNNKLYFTFQAKVQPDILASVVEYIFTLGYRGKIIPENNSIGLALINKLKEGICKDYIITEKTIDKITQRPTLKYGFNTNSKSKPLIISQLEEAIRLKQIEEFDERTKQDLINYYYDERGATNALKGSYDDLVIATALALYGTKQPKQIIFK